MLKIIMITVTLLMTYRRVIITVNTSTLDKRGYQIGVISV